MATGIMSFVNNECIPRVKSGAFAVGESFNTIVLLGLAGLTGNLSLVSSILTGGSKPLTNAAVTLETGLGKSLGKVFLHCLSAINPNALLFKKKTLEHLEKRPNPEKGGEHFVSAPGFFPAKSTPLFLYSFAKNQQRLINFLNHSTWFINRQLTVRLVAPISSAIGVLGALGTLLVGAGSLAVSILTLGSRPTPNSLVYHSLKSVGFILNQILQGILGFYRPAQLSYAKPLVEEVSANEEVAAEEGDDTEGTSPEGLSDTDNSVKQG